MEMGSNLVLGKAYRAQYMLLSVSALGLTIVFRAILITIQTCLILPGLARRYQTSMYT